MRALDSRRLRLTSILRPPPRSFLVLLLLFCALHGTRARSVTRDEENVAREGSEVSGIAEVGDVRLTPSEVTGKEAERTVEKGLTVVEDVGAEGEGKEVPEEEHGERKLLIDGEAINDRAGDNGLASVTGGISDEKLEEKTSSDDAGSRAKGEEVSGVLNQEDGEVSVAKKRRRNDVALSTKSSGEDGEGTTVGRPEGAVEWLNDEGIRRFDAKVDTDTDIISQQKVEKPEDNGEANDRQRLIDVSRTGVDVKILGSGDTEVVKNSEANLGDGLRIVDNEDEETIIQPEKPAEVVNVEQSQIQDVDEANDEGENELRSTRVVQESEEGKSEADNIPEKNADGEQVDPNESSASREYRYMTESQGKSRYKSSTVYLNAEEKKVFAGDQESIVEGQIKKLISIRDDALGAQHVDKLDEAKVLSPKMGDGIDEEVGFAGEGVRSVRSEGNDQAKENILQRWKDQAMALQEQVKNRTFLQYLREQAIDVLPDIPKFTEIQLLDTLKQMVAAKRSGSLNDSYVSDVNVTTLSENQLQIIKCAEQLVAVKQRQSFITNMVDCIRGLSVFNCMRIFVWPVVVDNLPESIGQNLGTLPIEINLVDLFQGNRAKSARAQDAHRIRLLTPESIVFSILTDALQSNPRNDASPTFIDPKNETLRKLLTYGQVEILRMAEKFLPEAARREYSDRMFSCVRRFEYFSCVKYFAWPMVKQHFPALPAFPDYQAWYPTLALFPEYPILPFPGFPEGAGELPEVIEADATRTRRPRPEAVIVQILQDTLKVQPKITTSPSYLDQSFDSSIRLIPREQLLSLHMAEQLIPVPYRPEFVRKNVRCIMEYNYLSCIKYSTWPTVRQYFPSLPDISGFIPSFEIPSYSEIFSYFPGLPSLPDLSEYFPGASTTTETPAPIPTDEPVVTLFLRDSADSSPSPDNLEVKILDILANVRNSLQKSPEIPSLIGSGNVVILTAVTARQLEILKLAESLTPVPRRAPLIDQVLSCLQRNNEFSNCVRYIVWPSIAQNVPDFPEFPRSEKKEESKPTTDTQTRAENQNSESSSNFEEAQKRIASDIAHNYGVKITSRTPLQDQDSRNSVSQSEPVISVTGTRFVPIFTEHPESVIFNILRSVQLSSPNVVGDATISITSKSQQFLDILNDQQDNIIRVTESLLPDAIRPTFVNKMIDCVRNSTFVACSRDVLWPILTEYFPRLPSFPNFGGSPIPPSNSSVSPAPPQNLTESSSNSDARPLLETNVKTGQHGDATVTITDTRFFPILNELPETVILNILRAVQLSIPNLPTTPVSTRLNELSAYMTQQQLNIMRIVESLIPTAMRPAFIERMITCIQNSPFLDCTRDITWPTVAQFFPRLPNFPNFGRVENFPQTRTQVPLEESTSQFLSPKAQADSINSKNEQTAIALKQAEEKLEGILRKTLEKPLSTRVEHSYLDINDPAVFSRLSESQINIVQLVEKGIPDAERPSYVARILDCISRENFISCTQHVSWPSLKQQFPNFPDFPNFGDLIAQLPGLPQAPDLGQLPSIPGLGDSPFQEIPGISNFPGGFPEFPGNLPQIPGGLPQFPGNFPQIPGGLPPVLGNWPPFRGGLPQFPDKLPQIPGGLPQLPSGIPDADSVSQFAGTPLRTSQGPAPSHRPAVLIPDGEESQKNAIPAIASSVEYDGVASPFPGNPPGIFIDVSNERVQTPEERKDNLAIRESAFSTKDTSRKRRSTVELFNSYYDVDDGSDKPASSESPMSPNITESEFLQLLVNITRNRKPSSTNPDSDPKSHFVDTLNSTIKNSLTADQYEILKIVEDLNEQTSNRGFLSQVVQCIRSLSFIRCMGIFVWPVITNNLPSLIGLPSLPSFPGFGVFGRSTETEVQDFFGMSTAEFEKELMIRQESIERSLMEWYEKLASDKFQTNVGFLKIRGYGNGELGISFAGFREGRGTKIKDNKNLPSILTIISDIMEEVLDQRPDTEKVKKDKDKKERSINGATQSDIQFLKNSEEYVDIQRSINDEQIITMFLNKIRSNASDFGNGDVKQYLNLEDAHNAFEVLFGTRLNDKLASKLRAFDDRLKSFPENNPGEPIKELNIMSLESQKNLDGLKVLPLKSEVTYDFERESSRDQEQRQRQKRGRNIFESFMDKYSDKYLKDTKVEKFEDDVDENRVGNGDERREKNSRTELIVYLPRLNEEIVPRRMTSSMMHLGRTFKTKMTQLMPGVGLLLSFLIQMALTHARAAASIAGMLSNMALGSAMFAMVRQSLFGQSDEPKIKYVYDNDNMAPGVSWPHGYEPSPYYRP